jgi:hypothetical protein
MKFFGGISAILGLIGAVTGGFVAVWYLIGDYEKINGARVLVHKTSPFTSLITVSGVFFTLAFLLFALALLADMLGRHRRITEELLYLARRRIYSTRRVRIPIPPPTEEEPHGAMGPTLHDSWSLPVMKTIKDLEVSATSGTKPEPARR